MKAMLVPAARMIFRLLNRSLKPFGILVSKPEIIHGSPRYSGATLWSRRLYDDRFYFELIKDVEGDVIESGVHWGYGILIFLNLMDEKQPRKVFGFDAFLGHSAPTEQDKSGGNFVSLGDSFKVSKEDVWKTLHLGTGIGMEELADKVEFVSGWIQDSMPLFAKRAAAENLKFAFVHNDCDIYEPFKATLENMWKFVAVGGIVILGKLDNPELMGKTLAVQEFLKTLPKDTYALNQREIIDNGGLRNYQSYLVKTG